MIPTKNLCRIPALCALLSLTGCAGPALFGDSGTWIPRRDANDPVWQRDQRFQTDPSTTAGTQPVATGEELQLPVERPVASQPGRPNTSASQHTPAFQSHAAGNADLGAPAGGTQGTAVNPGHQAGGQPQAPATNADAAPPLYTWDGGVVGAPERGSVVERDSSTHTLGPSDAGRMHIIELYQAVLDERDALLDEVDTLGAALEKAQEQLVHADTERTELEKKLLGVESERSALLQENQELAARLTTAQIRRLEAEKLLLEARLEWHRQKGSTGAPRESAAPGSAAGSRE